jgi:putative transposase
MEVVRTYKFRIYPTNLQKVKIDSTLGSCRYLYNQLLHTKKEKYSQEKVSISKFDLVNLASTIDLFTEVFSQTKQDVALRIHKAFNNFFRRVKNKEKPGFPRFKGKYFYHSFTYPQNGFKLLLEDHKINLSKIGKVKTKYHTQIHGTIKTCTVVKKNDRYFICISTKQEKEIIPKKIESIVGLDLGLKSFATLSNEEVIKNPRIYNKEVEQVQRKISKEKESKRKQELRKRLNTKWFRVQNQRHNFIHQTSKRLVDKYDCLVVEDLNIKGLQQLGNTKINKSMSNVSWFSFVNTLSYKAENAGKKVIKVNPKNTTKMCSNCSLLVPKELHERIHKCSCGLVMDRDLNAAKNILRLGRESLNE